MKLLKNLLLWLLALTITYGIAKYQKRMGPSYPIEGKAALGTHIVEFCLERTHGGMGDHRVSIAVPDPTVTGWVLWKRYKLDEPTQVLQMQWSTDTKTGQGILLAFLPHQPPAGKLEYQVELCLGDERLLLPKDEPAVVRFKGDVPGWVLLTHIVLLFGALFVGMRAVFSAVLGHKVKTLAWVTFVLIFAGGLIFGPIVQKYAFGAYWTGWPFGGDLTDNKTTVMALGWLVAVWMLRGRDGERRGRWWVAAATVLMFAVYLIPHSMRGSELDYSALPPDSLAKFGDSRQVMDTSGTAVITQASERLDDSSNLEK